MRRREKWQLGLVYLGLIVAVIFFVGPLVYLFITSLKPAVEVFDFSLPSSPSLRNYRAIVNEYPVLVYLCNSSIVSLTTCVLGVGLGALASYAFTRYRFRFSHTMHYSALVLRMLPGMALLIPLYLLFSKYGLVDTKFGLILSNTAFNLPFVMWTLHGFFREIPIELEEAAKIDGCSRLGVLKHIIWPLAIPGIAVTTIFVFINSWNEFDFAVVLASTDVAKTMPVALAGMMPEYGINWDHLSAAGMLYIVPTLILTFIVQRHLVQGLTAGAVKG